MSAPLRVRGLTLVHRTSRGETTAFEDIGFEAAAGEFITFVGPSGCGKSSLLSVIAGLSRPTRGEVTLDGVPVRGPSKDRAMVFQEHALFPWLDALGNVEFGLRLARVPAAQRRARALGALEMVGLSSFAAARPHELSGGMKQRVAIARALVLDPRVLLMDEPFASLDAQTRDGLLVKVQEIWMERRPTTLFVTHNVREAACLGDRVLVMSPRPGRIKAEFRIAARRPREIEDEAVVRAARDVKLALETDPSPGAG